MAYKPSDFRKGLKVMYRNDPFEIVEVQMSLRGRGRSKYKTKLKNLRTGAVLENVFTEQDSLDEGEFASRNMQYLYEDGEGFHFMDTDTYEQIAFSRTAIGDTRYFLKESEVYTILLLGREPLNVDLPAGVVLEITETEPAVRGDTVSNVTKNATTENGLVIKVPLFIDIGDKVKVDTRSMEYLGRA
ncbi:MAG TPA: elongation factor P [candidate division Zixibacteria bacterium]|nr:elongation factor P [candidate division Zixibacteria bacterium]